MSSPRKPPLKNSKDSKEPPAERFLRALSGDLSESPAASPAKSSGPAAPTPRWDRRSYGGDAASSHAGSSRRSAASRTPSSGRLSAASSRRPSMARLERQKSIHTLVQEQLEEWTGEAQVPYDERDLWGYGCHCNFVGDRPLSDMGRGKPKDKIDAYVFLIFVCRLLSSE